MDPRALQRISLKDYAQCWWSPVVVSELVARVRQLNELLLRNPLSQDRIQASYRWFATVAIFSSNRIEDTGLPLEETRQLVLKVLDNPGQWELLFHPEERDSDQKRDVIQHAAAFNYLCVTHQTTPRLTVDLILQTHRLLMKDTVREDGLKVVAGAFRTIDITVGRSGQPCVSPKHLPSRVEKLVEEYNEALGEQRYDPFVLASWLKSIFVHLHPFDDGNGRMSRLLLNWSLLSQGFPFPVSFLSGFSYKAKKNYHATVAAYDPGDPKSWKFNLPALMNYLVLSSVSAVMCSVFERHRHSPSFPQLTFPSSGQSMFSPLSSKRPDLSPDTLLWEFKDLSRQFKQQDAIDITEEESFRHHRIAALISHSRVPPDSVTRAGVVVPMVEAILEGEEDFSLPHANIGLRKSEEIYNTLLAYKYLCVDRLAPAGQPLQLTKDLILDTHLLICPDQGGKMRTEEVFIGAHLFPPPADLEGGLGLLVQDFNALSPDLHVAYRAAWIMYSILSLHPFLDGNGRLSRLLANWVVLSEDRAAFPLYFGCEDGVPNSGHKFLMKLSVKDRLSGGTPSHLATRILLSMRNSLRNALARGNE